MASNHSATPHSGLRSWLNTRFSEFAQTVAAWTGHPLTFMLAVTVVLVWIATGPMFGYSDAWQLVINTGTTIVTFLMVFLIQNTQNRDILTLQLKLSELVLAMKDAENRFAAIEDLTDEELEELHEECRVRAEMTRTHLESRRGRSTHGNGGRNGARGAPEGEAPTRQRASNHGKKGKSATARSRH
jgi:low affinity Fe/Cu permease